MEKDTNFPAPRAIIGVSHYHQSKGTHPGSIIVGPGVERVELVTYGRGWIEEANIRIEVSPGSLIWQVAGDNTINRSDFLHPYSCLSVNFRVEEEPLRRVGRFTRWEDITAVRTFTDELIQLWSGGIVPREVLCSYAYGRLYTQALLGQDMLERSQLPDPVRRARELIENEFFRPLRTRDLAEAAQCSEPYVHELFKKHLGMSPHRLLLQTRLKEASRRLTTSYDPIKEIAHDVGFSHAAAFCHAFKRYSGMTPALYRRRLQAPGSVLKAAIP